MNKITVNRLQLAEDFLTYLDQENILSELRSNVSRYEKTASVYLKKGNFIPPFHLQFKLDIMKIQEISEELHYLFIKEFPSGMDLAREVIFCGVALLLLNLNLKKSDLQLVPLVTNLPITRNIPSLLEYPSFGLESVQGVLMSRTTVTKYVRSSVYCCKSPCCPRNQWERYLENHDVCPECHGVMEENISWTDPGEEIICQLITLEAYHKQARFQVLNVRVKDELCNAVDFTIGDEYKVTGRLTEYYFEALNIQAKRPGSGIYSNIGPPKSILDLYRKIRFPPYNDSYFHEKDLPICAIPECPWAFVYALISPLGSHLIPISSYLHLKMGLILSLSSKKINEPPTPLLALGADSLNVQILFQTVGRLSEKYVSYSVANSYLGGAAKPGFQEDIVWFEAGQLILAAEGVCNLGDWTKLKKEQANYICQTIESSQIVLNKGELGKTNLIDFVQLKCAVWAYWCHINTSRAHQLQLKTLINVFGIPFLAEEKNECEMRKICWKNLMQGMRNSVKETTGVPEEDLREFIKIINNKELILTDRASQLIRSYFVISRHERPHCLPLGAIKTITSFAEAHARLALRNEVLYEDVVAIIYLYEEAISAFFGESMNSYPKLCWDQKEPIYMFKYITHLNHGRDINFCILSQRQKKKQQLEAKTKDGVIIHKLFA